MKKQITLLLAVLLALLLNVPKVMADDLLVADGTVTNYYVPVYGNYVDALQHQQFIYPESMIEDMADGASITQMQFYCQTSSITSWGSAQFTVKLAVYPDAAFTSASFVTLPSTAQVVYTGTLSVSNNLMVVTFATPFSYNGGNLIVDFESSSTGGYTSSPWYGVTSTGGSLGGYYSSYSGTFSCSKYDFIPKTNFTYTSTAEVDCEKPTDFVQSEITSSSVIVSWVSGDKNGGSALQYKRSVDTVWTDVPDVTSPYTLTDLEANTKYDIWVASVCGGEDTSRYVKATIKTACGKTTVTGENPFVYGFEDAPAVSNGVNDCWARINNSTYSYATSYPQVYANTSYSTYSRTGQRCMYFYQTYSGFATDQILIFPELVNDINTLRIRFWAKKSSSSYTGQFAVGVMDDQATASSFVALDTIDLTTTYAEYEVAMNTYQGGGKFIAIKFLVPTGSSSYISQYAYLDDVEVSILPNCIRPSDVTISGITTTSANIAWTPGLNETAWNLDYKVADDSVWTTVPVTANPYTLSGLTANTRYDVRIQSDCGSEVSEWTNTLQFATECDIFMLSEQNPLIEDFEGITEIPDCWKTNHYAGTSGSTWSISSNSTNNAHTGSGCLYLPDMDNGNRNLLILPKMNVPAANEYMINFWYNRTSSTYGSNPEYIRILVNTTPDTAGATELLLVNHRYTGTPVETTSGWFQYEATIPTSGDLFIMIDAYSGYVTGSYVDDIAVEKIPTCYPVSGITKSGVGRREFTVNWTPNSSHSANIQGYQLINSLVELNDSALAAATPIAVADTLSYKFTGLYRDTTYYVYVRPDCGSGDHGAWRSASVRTSKPLATRCPQVSGFKLDSVAVNYAGLSWTASTADYVGPYDLYIATEEMTDSALNLLESYTYTGSALAYTTNDLAEFTQYHAYVRVNCTDGDVDDGASVWAHVAFHTQSNCPAPASVTVDSLQKYSMYVRWTVPAGFDTTYTFDVQVKDAQDNIILSQANLDPKTRGVKVAGLNRNTLYKVYVRTNCSGDAHSGWMTASATTPDLDPDCSSTVAFEGTASQSDVPYSSCYNYGLSEQIYLASEMNGPASYGKIAFNVASAPKTSTIAVYMLHTTKAAFTSTSDWVVVSASDKVFEGPVTFTTGWNELQLTTPFEYNGTDNLMLVVDNNTGSYSCTMYFYGVSGTGYKAIYKNQDGSDINPLATGMPTGARNTTRPAVKFVACLPAEACPALRIAPTSADRTHNSARINWTPAKGDWANTYELYVATEPMTAEPAAEAVITGIDTTSYVVSGLQSNTTYYAYVRIKCDKGGYDDGISGWSPVCEFQTELPCLRPENMTKSVITSNSVNLQWFDQNNTTAWDIEVTKYVVGDTATDTIVTVVPVTEALIAHDTITGIDTVRYTLTGLDAVMPYALRLRANCGNDGVSHWALTGVNFTTKNNNTDIDTVTISGANVMSYTRRGNFIDIVLRADNSLENRYVTFTKKDYNATVRYNGKTLTSYTSVTFAEDTARIFTVLAADTNVRTDYQVLVHHESCATPYGIAAGNIGRRNATITWNMGATGLQTYDYILSYVELNDSALAAATPMQFSDSLRSFNVTVDRDTMCYFYLRHNCGNEQSEWISTSFQSKGLVGCDEYIVGTDETTSPYIPTNHYYNYSTSAQIYTPTEIGVTGDLSSISYKFYTSGSERNLKIYLVETDKSTFTSTSDWPVVTAADKVFDGSAAFSYGWNEIQFAQTFNYSGTKNLMVVFDDNTGDYDGSGYNFSVYHATAGATLYLNSDGTNLDPTISNTNTGTLLDIKNHVKFGHCFAQDACPDVENLAVTDYQATEVTLEWNTTADYPGTYDIVVSTTPVVNFDSIVPTMTVATTEATLTGLTRLTHYYAYVRANCDHGDGSSDWTLVEFTTQASCYAPLSIASAVTGKQTAHVAWVPGTDQQANNFAYVLSTVAIPDTLLDQQTPTVQGITTDNVDVTGLASATHYYLYLHNVCGEGDASPWLSTEFTTPVFQPAVINLTISDVTYNTFVASWERDTMNFASETEWQIAWAPTADSAAVLTWANVSEASRVIFGLNPETEYAFYVRPFEGGVPGPQMTANATTLADPGNCQEFIAGTATVTYVPMYSNYQGSYNVQIYTAEELAAQGYTAGDILGIAFYQTSCSSTTDATKYQKTTTVWMKNTTKASFSGTTDWEAGMTEVMAAKSVDFNKVNDWVEMTLDEPFTWDGTSNLAVAVLAYSGGYTSMSFRGGTADVASSIYSRADATNWVITDGVPSITSTVSTTSQRANIKLCFPAAACPAPKAVAAENIKTTSADITWRPGGTETAWQYVYGYAPMTAEELAAATPVAASYPRVSLSGLTIDADVYVYVRANCTENSTWTMGKFRTIESCSAPLFISAYSAAENTMTMMVDSTGAHGVPMNYTYEYWMTGSETVMTVTGTDSVTVTGLQAGTYEWRVKATCQTETPDGTSRWTNGDNVSVCGVYNISDTKNYVQDFENISYLSQACIDAYGDDTDPYINTSSYNAHSGSKYLYLNNGYYSGYGYESFVAMPKFNSTEEMFFSFYYKNYSAYSDYGQFIYGYHTANGTFYPVDTLDRKSSYTLARYSMNNLPDSAANVAIKFADGYYYGYIDDIRVAVQRNTVINDTMASLESYYNKNGFYISRYSMGTRTDSTTTRIATNGITDTLYTLNLHMLGLHRDTTKMTVCPGTEIQFYSKTIVAPTGNSVVYKYYFDTVSVRGGVDTIHALYLKTLPTVKTPSETRTACGSYTWRGRTLTESGEYFDTVRYAQGCDSAIFKLTLTINPTYLFADAATIYDYELPYIWRGQALTETGVYTDSLKTTLGCDSVFMLTLTVNQFVCVAPTNLVATLISNKSFQFDWVNPTLGTENEQPNYFTYVLSATELDDPSAVKPTKAQRTTTMAQLTAALYNTEYHFYVKNVCNGRSSDWAHVAISSISGRPAVDSLHVVDAETRAITIAWKRHKYGTELKWKVDVALASDSSVVRTLVASTTSMRITGLDPETEYIFTVSPRLNSTNFGDPATVNGTTLDKPAMPVNVYGEITANRQLTFYWQNGSQADANNFSYKLSSKYIDMNKDKYSDNPDVEGFADTTVAFNSLSYGTTYYFYVRNVRATDGAASDWALCYVKTNLQNPPVKNIHAEDATPTTLTVAWERGNAASAEPRWIVVMRRESDNALIDSVNVNVMTATFTGLTRGTDYVVTVYPRINSKILGTAASAVLSTVQTCEAPINLTYVNTAYRAYTFSWENPTVGTTEVEPNNFTYILVNAAEPINPDSTYPTKRNFTETTLSVAKLSKGATYYFYVRNEYDGAVSAWAGPIVITVPATASSAAHYGDDEEEENVEIIAENVVPAEAYVNYDKLFVENIAEGSNVTVIDASGRVVFNAKVNDTRMEYDLYVRGVYMVVIRGKQEQTIKVVY